MPLKKFKRGKIWYVRGTVRGETIYESTETDDEALAETIRARREARLIDDSVFGRKATTTFLEAAESYLKAGGSARFIGQDLGNGKLTGLLGHFNTKKLHSLTQNDLDEAAKKLYPNASPETRNRQCYTPFIAIWNHAAKNQWADVRAWQRPRKVKGTANRKGVARSGTKPVSYERAWTFISQMSPAPAMVMTTLFYTGLRPIELFSLRPEDVDVEKRWGVLSNTKTGEPRGFPIHEMLVPMLQHLAARNVDALFLSQKGEPYPLLEDGGGQIDSAIKGARRRLKALGTPIDDVSPYTGRHTVSTQLVVNGVHPYLKDQILGHAADSMSRHYTNIPQQPLIDAINTLPVIEEWASAAWLTDPLTWQRKLVRNDNTGRRGKAA